MPMVRRMTHITRSFLSMVLIGALALAGLCGCQPKSPSGAGAISGDVAKNADLARDQTARGFDLIEKKQYAEAEPVLKKAIEADAMYGPAHNDLGLVYYRMKRYYDAAWELENAAKLMPRQAAPRNNLGLVMEAAGKLTEAMTDYTLASQIDPDNPEYLGNLARVRMRLGLHDEETRRVLETLISRDTRPQWIDWARLTLIRLKAEVQEPLPATAPAANEN